MTTTTSTLITANSLGDFFRALEEARVGKYFYIPGDWTTVTSDRGLKATIDECEALAAALYPPDNDDEDEYNGGFDLIYDDDEVYVFAEHWEDCDWHSLPQAFLTSLGALIAKNGLEYLEFGAAAESGKPSSPL